MNEYLEVATQLAHQAGEIMRKNFTNGMKREWKEDGTPVTITDTTINALVVKTLSEKFPSHGIIGEEESLKKESEYQWICDPLDGTFSFSHASPIFVFSLALTKNGESIVGVVHDAMLRRTITAIKGKGTYLNGEKVSVSVNNSFEKSIVDVETWSDAPDGARGVMERLIERNVTVSKILSTVYAGMLVAIGETSATIFTGTTPWDGAAVKIIVEEAGGKVTNLKGEEQRYDGKLFGFIASNNCFHSELVTLCNV